MDVYVEVWVFYCYKDLNMFENIVGDVLVDVFKFWVIFLVYGSDGI